jgi:Thiamine pyrophosphate enzyme, N-terminal TPP binding domain
MTQWSCRLMAARRGVSKSTINNIWQSHNLKPHRVKTFKLSRDAKSLEKLTDVVGLTAADVLIETLIDWGIDVVFGLPGDGVNNLMESLRTHQDRIRFIRGRHEESAASMPVATRNVPADWACVWQLQVREEFIFSTAYTMPRGRPTCAGNYRFRIPRSDRNPHSARCGARPSVF